MESTAQSSFRRTFVLPAVAALMVAGTLFVLGRLFGSLVVLSTSIHWLLLFTLIVGARSQVVDPKAVSSLPVRRVFAALLFLMITFVGVALADGFAFVVPTDPTDEGLGMGLGGLMLGAAAGSAVTAHFFQINRAEPIKDAPGLVKLSRLGT